MSNKHVFFISYSLQTTRISKNGFYHFKDFLFICYSEKILGIDDPIIMGQELMILISQFEKYN